jgi:hypothetical protein
MSVDAALATIPQGWVFGWAQRTTAMKRAYQGIRVGLFLMDVDVIKDQRCGVAATLADAILDGVSKIEKAPPLEETLPVG